jgi:hypothetical protein
MDATQMPFLVSAKSRYKRASNSAATGQHRTSRERQDRTDLVPHTAPGPRIGHLRQSSHHTRADELADIGSGGQVLKDRVDRR